MPRAYNHDYRDRCFYHITMTKAPVIPAFGHLSGPNINRSPLGQIIAANIWRISNLNPCLKLLQYVIMPDHVHFLVQVTDRIEKPFGSYIGMLKVRIGQQYRSQIAQADTLPIFAPDFYDRIIWQDKPLDAGYQYIRDNPRRLAVRKANPDFFRRINNLTLAGKQWQCYGNIHLLYNPFKAQVVIHRADSSEIRERNRLRWLHLAANGGVLVSPFISKDEKQLRDEAESAGAKIILLTNEVFPDRYKPSAHDFTLCEQGRLLILAPASPLPTSRQTFLYLNQTALHLCQF